MNHRAKDCRSLTNQKWDPRICALLRCCATSRERMEHNFSPIEERKEKLQCRCKPPSSSAAVLRGHPYITFYILYPPHTTPYLSFSIIPAWVNPSPLYVNVIHGWPLIIRVCHMGSVGLSATPQAPTSQRRWKAVCAQGRKVSKSF